MITANVARVPEPTSADSASPALPSRALPSVGGRSRRARHPRDLLAIRRITGRAGPRGVQTTRGGDGNLIRGLPPTPPEIPLRRLPLLAEIANMAALLASDQASAMTGSRQCYMRTDYRLTLPALPSTVTKSLNNGHSPLR
ncbi:MAG: hypothetical protein U0528_12130 [Anaerolineae bacterium]